MKFALKGIEFTDFSESCNLLYDRRIDSVVEQVKTEQKWQTKENPDWFNRVIQVAVSERREIKIIVNSEHSAFTLLQSESVELQPNTLEMQLNNIGNVTAYDIELSTEIKLRTVEVTMQYTVKSNQNITNILSNDAIKENNKDAYEFTFTVTNPTFKYNNIELSNNNGKLVFFLPHNSVTEKLNIGDDFYFYANSYNSARVEVVGKDEDFVSFQSVDAYASIPLNASESVELSVYARDFEGDNLTDKSYDYTIFTMLKPVIEFVTNEESETAANGRQIQKLTTIKRIAKTRIFLETKELDLADLMFQAQQYTLDGLKSESDAEVVEADGAELYDLHAFTIRLDYRNYINSKR